MNKVTREVFRLPQKIEDHRSKYFLTEDQEMEIAGIVSDELDGGVYGYVVHTDWEDMSQEYGFVGDEKLPLGDLVTYIDVYHE